jgi:hypothetical protein
MAEPNEIQPALTDEEWAAHRQHQQVAGYDRGDPHEHFRDMARSNDELPSSDPRKITRADLQTIDTLAQESHLDFFVDRHTPPYVRAAIALRAKLEALLPPETV